MKQNFDVLIMEEAKTFIKSLDKKLQKKVAYNIQKASVKLSVLCWLSQRDFILFQGEKT